MKRKPPSQRRQKLHVYFSDFFGVEPGVLEEHGVFNVSLINDLPLFIDPFLLFNSKKPEYTALHEEIIRYLRFLRDKFSSGQVEEGLLRAWYTFNEVKQNWLGFSRIGNDGRGLDIKFARALNRNLNTVFSTFGQEKIARGSHLEKLTLISSGVGRDNISDFTTNLIKGFLLRFTEDFAKEHVAPHQCRRIAVEKVAFNYDTESWERSAFTLPMYGGDYVLLTPKDILTRDETWISRRDLIETISDIAEALPNAALRTQFSNYMSRQLSKNPTNKEVRAARASAIEQFPALIEHYLKRKEDTGDSAQAESSKRVRESEEFFIEQIGSLVERLSETTKFYRSAGDTYSEARKRVMFLKDVIENKDGYRFFYYQGKPIHREEHLQIMYRLTWLATPLDVNREVNNGRGPVDFKVSRGTDRTLVEFKLASNKKLRQNLEHQVEVYQRASDTDKALKVILFFTQEEEDKVSNVLKDLKLQKAKDIILIDACKDNKPSASTVR